MTTYIEPAKWVVYCDVCRWESTVVGSLRAAEVEEAIHNRDVHPDKETE